MKKDGFSAQSPVDVMIPNPVSFTVQKMLVQKYRRPEKQAQDALYIHDTLELFGGELPELRALWQKKIRPRLTKAIIEAIEPLIREQFGTVTDVIRNAARIPQDRRLEPDRVQAACEYGLQQIFG